MAKYLSPNQRIQKEYQDRKAAEKEKQKAQEKKNAEAKERETNYKEATKTSNFTHPTPPSGSQPPQKTTATSNNNGSSYWVRSSKQPTAAQKMEYNEQKNRENGQDSIGRRQYEERKREEKNKVLAYKKSQRNTSKGYQDMIKRREDAEIKKYEEAFGRKINKGWR
jgi:hypothetical protein